MLRNFFKSSRIVISVLSEVMEKPSPPNPPDCLLDTFYKVLETFFTINLKCQTSPLKQAGRVQVQ